MSTPSHRKGMKAEVISTQVHTFNKPSPNQPPGQRTVLATATSKQVPAEPLVSPQLQPQQEKLPIHETDPRYFSIQVPSLFKFYDEKVLSIRHIKGFHQAKFAKAATERSLRYLVEAISSTLGDGFSAFKLTPQDFNFVMYWQRKSSFPKNPQLIKGSCTNEEHVRRVNLPPRVTVEFLRSKLLEEARALRALTPEQEQTAAPIGEPIGVAPLNVIEEELVPGNEQEQEGTVTETSEVEVTVPMEPEIDESLLANPDENGLVPHPEYLKKETLEIEQIVDNSTLTTLFLDDLDLLPFTELHQKYGMAVETMQDMCEYEDYLEQLALEQEAGKILNIDEDELLFMYTKAAFIKHKLNQPGPKLSLKERIKIVEEMDPDDIAAVERWIQVSTVYGVNEIATIKCKECGALHRVEISIEALDFLP